MDTNLLLDCASGQLYKLSGQTVGLITVDKPTSIDFAKFIVKSISKLSSLNGNLFELLTVDKLNAAHLSEDGTWIRQDPGFPDASFRSDSILPNPGVEIKAWFPLATEITARFKDSQDIFVQGNINVAIIAWIPEFVFWGRPKVLDVLILRGLDVAKSRDNHYFHPPHYIVEEPEDTSDRTSNLQQTNTAGFVIQNPADKDAAQSFCDRIGLTGQPYSTDKKFQALIKQLKASYNYRLDTNYAKIDRIKNPQIDIFKQKIESTVVQELTIKEWSMLLKKNKSAALEKELTRLLSLS